MKIFKLLLSFALAISFGQDLSAQTNGDKSGYDSELEMSYVENQLLVTFFASNSVQRIDVLPSQEIVTGLPLIDKLFRQYKVRSFEPLETVDSTYVLTCQECDVVSLRKSLRDFPKLLHFVDFNYTGVTTQQHCSAPISTNDPLAGANQSTWENMEFPCAWTIADGSTAVVGLIDVTGSGLGHSDFSGKILSSQNLTGTSFNNHGNNMGSIIASAPNNNIGFAGAGYETKLRLYNVGNSETTIHSSQVINAINFAVQANVDVINMSFTFPGHGAWRTAVENAISSGVVVVTASGNGSYNRGCNIPGIICVSSVDANDDHGATGFQSRSTVSLTANDRLFEVAVSGNGYGTHFGGTSASAAFVSSAAALMKDLEPTLSQSEVKHLLELTSDDISGVADNGTTYDGLIGAGRLSAYHAVAQVNIKYSGMTGPSIVCGNETHTYSLPEFEGATYNWQTQGQLTMLTGQGTRTAQVRTASSSFQGGRVECIVTFNGISTLKAQTLFSNGCGGGYYMKAYPNPASDELFVSVDHTKDLSLAEPENLSQQNSLKMSTLSTERLATDLPQTTRYALYDYSGRLVRESISRDDVTIPLSGLPKGLYLLQVTTGTAVLTESIEVW